MKRRTRPSTSYRAGKRGRHKHRGSSETKRWVDEHMVPERPSWMPVEMYTQLNQLRREL